MEFESKPKFVTFDMNGTLIQRAAIDEGLLLLLCGAWNQVVRMIPALVIDETAVDEGLRAWETAVEAGTSGAARRRG